MKSETSFTKKLLQALLLAVLLVGGAGAGVLLAEQAEATDRKPRPQAVCGQWQMRGATGAYPAVTFGEAPAGSEMTRYRAKLTKPAAGVAPGVEFASRGLAVEATETLTVSAKYVLSGGASPSAGAVRMFGYTAIDGDTLNDAPQWMSAADAGSGTMSFTLAAGDKLGTFGFAYDASNDSAGVVTLKDVFIGKTRVRFTPCPKPSGSASSSASASASVSASTSTSASASASPAKSELPAVPGASRSPSYVPPALALTGPSGPLLAGVAGLALAAGVVLLVLGRRRRESFRS